MATENIYDFEIMQVKVITDDNGRVSLQGKSLLEPGDSFRDWPLEPKDALVTAMGLQAAEGLPETKEWISAVKMEFAELKKKGEKDELSEEDIIRARSRIKPFEQKATQAVGRYISETKIEVQKVQRGEEAALNGYQESLSPSEKKTKEEMVRELKEKNPVLAFLIMFFMPNDDASNKDKNARERVSDTMENIVQGKKALPPLLEIYASQCKVEFEAEKRDIADVFQTISKGNFNMAADRFVGTATQQGLLLKLLNLLDKDHDNKVSFNEITNGLITVINQDDETAAKFMRQTGVSSKTVDEWIGRKAKELSKALSDGGVLGQEGEIKAVGKQFVASTKQKDPNIRQT